MHREMLLSAASKLHHNALWTQSPSPAPFEPAVQVRSPDSRLDSFHMAKLELEASAMENHRASSLVTRAALKDAMRVLDENRALKQLQAQTEGRLMVSEQEGQALREMLAADRASTRSLQAALQSKITALELEVARLVNSRECLREEVILLHRHCYLIISTSPSNHSRPNGQHTQSAERASAGAFEGDSREAGGAHGELSRSQVAPAQARNFHAFSQACWFFAHTTTAPVALTGGWARTGRCRPSAGRGRADRPGRSGGALDAHRLCVWGCGGPNCCLGL